MFIAINVLSVAGHRPVEKSELSVFPNSFRCMRTPAFSSFSSAKPLKYETKTDKQVSASSGIHIVEYPEEYTWIVLWLTQVALAEVPTVLFLFV